MLAVPSWLESSITTIKESGLRLLIFLMRLSMFPASQYVGSIIATDGFSALLSFEDNVHEPRPTIFWGNAIWFTFFTRSFCETAFRINLYNVKSCYISLFIIIAHAQENTTFFTLHFFFGSCL